MEFFREELRLALSSQVQTALPWAHPPHSLPREPFKAWVPAIPTQVLPGSGPYP
jgi:hypothetical protein